MLAIDLSKAKIESFIPCFTLLKDFYTDIYYAMYAMHVADTSTGTGPPYEHHHTGVLIM
jgi:hypothetical protein